MRASADHPSPHDPKRDATAGFTLVEVILVLALIGMIAGLGLTSYLRFIEKARIAKAVVEIASIANTIGT